MSLTSKILKKQNEAVQKEAQKRAEKIDAFGDRLLKMAAEEGMTVNDLQVVLDTLNQNMKVVFYSHQVKDFMEAPATDKV